MTCHLLTFDLALHDHIPDMLMMPFLASTSSIDWSLISHSFVIESGNKSQFTPEQAVDKKSTQTIIERIINLLQKGRNTSEIFFKTSCSHKIKHDFIKDIPQDLLIATLKAGLGDTEDFHQHLSSNKLLKTLNIKANEQLTITPFTFFYKNYNDFFSRSEN